MFNLIHLEPAQVPDFLRLGYRGKTFRAQVTTRVNVPLNAGQWEDGSRETYRMVDTESGAQRELPPGARVALTQGVLVVMQVMFMGRDMGLTYFVRQDDCAKLLPKMPGSDLSSFERMFLIAAATLKSKHGGKNRYEMLREEWIYGLGKPAGFYPTPDEWEKARENLYRMNLVNTAGAITVAGRNAIGNRRLHHV